MVRTAVAVRQVSWVQEQEQVGWAEWQGACGPRGMGLWLWLACSALGIQRQLASLISMRCGRWATLGRHVPLSNATAARVVWMRVWR